MRPGYTIVRHPGVSDDREGWLNGYRIAVRGTLAPEFSLHKSRIQRCATTAEYEELMCESADDLLAAKRDGAFGT